MYTKNTLSTMRNSYLTSLNMPIQCSYSNGNTGKCYRTAKASAKIYCDSTEYESAYSAATTEEKKYIIDLKKYYTIFAEKQADITFSSIETYDMYKKMNDDVVEDLEFTI